ncbi:MAG: glycosyltransferase family 2 protein [Actinomycetales bacterium]|nr:glycosyltransferase family 2 protein [Actinomycetales bacterium]
MVEPADQAGNRLLAADEVSVDTYPDDTIDIRGHQVGADATAPGREREYRSDHTRASRRRARSRWRPILQVAVPIGTLVMLASFMIALGSFVIVPPWADPRHPLVFIGVLVPVGLALIDVLIQGRAFLCACREIEEDGPRREDFMVLIPIFGDIKYLKNISFLSRYSNRVVLCTTTWVGSAFDKELERVAELHGFNIVRTHVLPKMIQSGANPNPWRLFTNALEGDVSTRDKVIRDSIEMVGSNYCVFLDGDTVTDMDLGKVIGLFADEGLDVASVRVLASRQETLAEKLQAVEYELAMDARKVYPWLTSGACIIARMDAISTIMRSHSLFFSGGDIEVGVLAKKLHLKVGHIPCNFYTDVPETLKAWFKQRVNWCAGGFRHAVVNAWSYKWRHPLHFLYATCVVYAMAPLRWHEVITRPEIIPFVIVLYWSLIFIIRGGRWRGHYFLFPIYALVQVMVLVPLGMVRYCKMAVRAKNVGIIRLRNRKAADEGGESGIEQLFGTDAQVPVLNLTGQESDPRDSAAGRAWAQSVR